MANTNILFPSKQEFGVRNNLFTYQCLHESIKEREPGYMKKKERRYYKKLLHLNGITSAPSATRVEKTNLADRDTPRTRRVTPSQCTAITKGKKGGMSLYEKMELIP